MIAQIENVSVTLTPLEQSLLLGFLVLFSENGAWIDSENELTAIDATMELIEKVITAVPPTSGGTGYNMYEKIADYAPSGSDNFMDFAPPTSGYKEFLIKTFGGSNTSGARLAIRFNADATNGNYVGVNQTQASVTARNFLIGIKSSDQESHGELRIFLPNSTTVKKTFWAKSGFSNEFLDAVGYWNNTSAITAIRLTSSNPTVVAGFRVELWGLPV